MDRSEEQRKQARLRKVGERLTGDSNLRDALTDEQANELLGWGLARLEREVERTLDLPEDDALPVLEAFIDDVRDVMLRTNRAVEELPQGSKARSQEHLLRLVDSLCEVDSRSVHVNDMIALEELVLAREELDSDKVFQRLMSVIRQEEEE
jgi:hypothetical protein